MTKHVLLVKLTSMGDVIHTLPALTDLQKQYPNIKIDWAIDPDFKDIASWHPMVNKIIEIHCALDIATFNLFLLKKKSLCLGKLSTSDVVIEISTTLAS